MTQRRVATFVAPVIDPEEEKRKLEEIKLAKVVVKEKIELLSKSYDCPEKTAELLKCYTQLQQYAKDENPDLQR